MHPRGYFILDLQASAGVSPAACAVLAVPAEERLPPLLAAASVPPHAREPRPPRAAGRVGCP